MRHDLTGLGELEFEDLVQAVAIRVLGPGVQVFGDGPDGGREAIFDGPVRYPESTPGGSWDGYGVVQAKFRRQPLGAGPDAVWLRGQVTAELEEWSNSAKNRVKHGRLPQYLIFATNVALSAVPGTGGHASVDTLIDRYATRLGVRGWRVWDYEQICRYLDAYADVRQTYAAFTTPGDVLAALRNVVTNNTAVDLGPTMTTHAAKELLAHQWVRLGQAGDVNNDKLVLGNVAIDLAAEGTTGNNAVPGIAAEIIRRADRVRRADRSRELDVAIVGGPGQGKSTIGQLLCQVYRLALLTDRPPHTLSPETVEVRDQLRRDLGEIGMPTPACRRWPVQVTLSKYGDAIAGSEDVSLLRYIAAQVSRRTTEPVTAGQLREWLRTWPWLLVLDGLDEVAAPSVRETLLRNVADLFIDIADVNGDVLVVATTRPQGYADEFPQRSFQHFHLRELTAEQATTYANRLARARHGTDPDTAEQALDRVARAAQDPATARLMTTPLQVTIMSLLLERRVRAPQDRHSLFDGYYTAIFEREIGKETSVAAMLEQHRGHIHAMHERVGLLLQMRAEHAGDAEALLPEDDLRRLAVARLTREEYPPAEAQRLAAELVKVATQRLVLLVGRTAGTVGFEIRSLQEFMAARALVHGPDDDVLHRLRLLGPSAHWRNTWLFAAGRLFTQHEHLRDSIITLLEDLDTAGTVELLMMPGARLAADLLNDDVGINSPRYRRLLARHALSLANLSPEDALRLRKPLFDAASTNDEIRRLVSVTLDRALAGDTRAALGAVALLQGWKRLTGPVAAEARQKLARYVARPAGPMPAAMEIDRDLIPPGKPLALTHPDLARVMREHLDQHAFEPDINKALRELMFPDFAAFLEGGRRGWDLTIHHQEPRAERIVEALAVLTDSLPPGMWRSAQRLASILTGWYEHRPVAEALGPLLPPDIAPPPPSS